MKIYSSEFSNKLADELANAGKYTVQTVSDYYLLRRQVEDCNH